jgi:quinol-cytochrome oxidoreductase complex cytochrome b subunit
MKLPNHSEDGKDECIREVPFFPNVLLSEMTLAIAVIGLLAISVSLFPLKLGEKFNPTTPPTLLEPEWYFMGVYQFLKTQNVQPLHGIMLMAALGIFMILVPFIDRSPERWPLRRPIFTAIAFFAIIEFLSLTIYGYLSPGQVGSFSNSQFTIAFLTANLLALGLVVLVFAVNRRIMRGVRK